MKILSIKMMNLNSLKGEQGFRLDESPIADAGLFAITGPTGAGKTTILDAICVALYGQVHRHGRHAEEIMTRHTDEAWAEVEFEVKGGVYRSKWSITRSKAGLIKPKRELAEKTAGDWKIISDQKITDTQIKINELCGLDYEQFMRSVILSQGDFTRFLKASENERGELLEKITDTAVYSKISAFVYQENKAKGLKLKEYDENKRMLNLLEEEQLTAMTAELASLTGTEDAQRRQREALAAQLEQMRSIGRLQGRVSEVEAALTMLQERYRQYTPDYEKLQLHRKAAVHQPDMARLSETTASGGNLAAQLEALDREIPALKDQLVRADEHKRAADDKSRAAQQQLEQETPVIDEVINRDNQILHERQQYEKLKADTNAAQVMLDSGIKLLAQKEQEVKELNAEIERLSTWVQQNAAAERLPEDIARLQTAITELEQIDIKCTEIAAEIRTQSDARAAAITEQARLARLMEAAVADAAACTARYAGLQQSKGQLLGPMTTDELDEAITTLPALVQGYTGQAALAVQCRDYKAEISRLTERREKDYDELETAKDAYTAQKKELDAGTATFADLKKIVDLSRMVKNYEADRKKLQESEPCPLCGSRQHPYAESGYEHSLSEDEQRMARQETLLRELDAAMRKKSLHINTLEVELRTVGDSLAQAGNALQKGVAAYDAANRQLTRAFAIEDIAAIQQYAAEKQAENNRIQATQASWKKLEKEIAATRDKKEAAERSVLTLDGNLKVTEGRMSNLQQTLQAYRDQLVDLTWQKNQQSEQAVRAVMPYDVAFDFATRRQIVDGLQRRRQEYQQNGARLQQCQVSAGPADTERISAANAIAEHTRRLEDCGRAVATQEATLARLVAERTQIFGDRRPAEERARLAREAEATRNSAAAAARRLGEIEKELALKVDRNGLVLAEKIREQQNSAKYADVLEAKIKENGFAHLAAVSAAIIDESAAQQIEQHEKSLLQKIHTGTEALATARRDLDAARQHHTASDTEESLTEQLSAADAGISAINQKKGSLSAAIWADAAQKERHRGLLERIEQLKQDIPRWENLSRLIGSADGAKFRRYAQGLTLELLASLANRHLEKLTDRYALHKPADKEMELQIIDAYQAGVQRPVNTLSGGESFLVSLALALGLSDMAGRKTNINSLFIDEGFGTLDADTLEEAISALENLQANGKTIGIISHMQALKERIGTQVQVSRLSGGHSRIKVVAGAVAVAGT